jgi:hypothetical protein
MALGPHHFIDHQLPTMEPTVTIISARLGPQPQKTARAAFDGCKSEILAGERGQKEG